MRVGEAIVQTLWVGALWSVGYLAAPALFTYMETPAAAGRIAGELFTVVTWLSMVCAVLLILASAWRPRRGNRLRIGLILAMVLLLGISEWGVRPVMEAARLPDGTPGEGFGMLHGISATLYLAASLAGVLLVGLSGRDQAGGS